METGFIVPENIDPQRPPKELTGGELEDYACPEGDTLLTPKYSIIKSQCMRMVKNKIIGSTKAKMEYFNEGLLDEILHLLNKHDVPSEIIFNMLSILFCYTNKKKSNPKIGYDFNKICEAFAPHKDFCAKLVSTLNTTMINKGDDRIIDLCLQIIRNCLTNNIMRARDAFMQDKDQEIVTLVPQNASDKVDICKMFAALTTNNKRVSLVAQIISELCKDFPEVKDLLILDKTIIDSIAAKIQTLESSLLTCLINLCSGHNEITNYVREQINIAKLISFLRYQYPDINCKVAYLATLLSSDEEMTDDHKSLIKQIVFQILRMLFTSPDCQIDTKIVLEGITMLHNLVGNEHREQETQSNIASFGLNQDHRLRKYALGQICDTGIIDHLAQILKKSSTKELFRQNFVNNNDKDQLELN